MSNMFIHLDNSLIVDPTNTEAEDIERAVRNLAVAAFESKHILYGDFDVIKTMRARMDGNKDAKMVLDKIYHKYGTMACPPEITYYIKVARENGEKEKDEDGREFAKVSYRYFMDTLNTQACNLVSEDYNDCYFYRIVLERFKREKGCNMSCRFEDCSGSGERTLMHLQDLLFRKKQITLCVVDSDRKYKEQEIEENSTSGKCRKIGRNIPTYKFVVLDVHEVENLVPLNVVDKMVWTADSIENKDAFDYLRYNAKTEEVLPYFDIKNGVKKDNRLMTDPKYMTFAKTCYEMNPLLMKKNGKFEQYVDGLEEGAVVYPHLRKGLLKKYLEYRKEDPECEIELLEFQQTAWMMIGQVMLNMGCSRNVEAMV